MLTKELQFSLVHAQRKKSDKRTNPKLRFLCKLRVLQEVCSSFGSLRTGVSANGAGLKRCPRLQQGGGGLLGFGFNIGSCTK